LDLLAHGLWAAAGAEMLRRGPGATRRTRTAIVALSVLPDVPQTIPLFVWAVSVGSLQSLYQYAFAVPGTEPWLPLLVQAWAHHLHCIPHSMVVAGIVTLLVWRMRRAWLVALLGWWSHIAIDIFTHSADYYAVPVLYPFSYRGFDGVAWNSPSFMVVNYLMLATVWLLLWMTRHRRRKADTNASIENRREDGTT
jgi:hypothetical protein